MMGPQAFDFQNHTKSLFLTVKDWSWANTGYLLAMPSRELLAVSLKLADVAYDLHVGMMTF